MVVLLSWRKWAIMQLLNCLCRIASNQLVLCRFQGWPWALVLHGLHASLHCTLIPAQLLALWSPFYTSCTAERWRTSFASCRCLNIRIATFRSSSLCLFTVFLVLCCLYVWCVIAAFVDLKKKTNISFTHVLGFLRKCSMHVPSCFPGASLSCSSCGWPAFGCRLHYQVKQTELIWHNYSCWLRTDKRFPPVCSTLNIDLHLLPHLWLLREDVHPSQNILGPGGFPPCLLPLRNEVTRQKVDWAPTVCMWGCVCVCTVSLSHSAQWLTQQYRTIGALWGDTVDMFEEGWWDTVGLWGKRSLL